MKAQSVRSGFSTVPAATTAVQSLPSWNDGAAKQAILEFVARVTNEKGTDFVPLADRIAVFDNDGTLWSEQPIYFQFQFAVDRIKALAPEHPEWKTTQPFKALLENDMQTLAAAGEKGVVGLLATAHSGMTTEEFEEIVADWLLTARHARFKQPYNRLVFQPMVELLQFLRANGFKTFIVSGGGVEFIRVFAEQAYGIPPEQVVGSSGVVSFEHDAGGAVRLVKHPEVEFVDDGAGKPVGINRFIGHRPLLAFGNSDGDHQMLQYTAAGAGPRFMGLVHHTDAAREYAYDRDSRIGKLDAALDEAEARGWTVVSMQDDWRLIYPDGPTTA
jgi:phosphoglycolate phosphatase-like HAD superfamily hydrolase